MRSKKRHKGGKDGQALGSAAWGAPPVGGGPAAKPKRRGSSDQVGRRQGSLVEGGRQSGWTAVVVTATAPTPGSQAQCFVFVYDTPVTRVPQAPLICIPPKQYILCSSLQFCPLPKIEAWIPRIPSMSIWAVHGCHFAFLFPPGRAGFLSAFRPIISLALLRWLPCLLSPPLQISPTLQPEPAVFLKTHVIV